MMSTSIRTLVFAAAAAVSLLGASAASAKIVKKKAGIWPFRHTVQWNCQCQDAQGKWHLISTSNNEITEEVCNQGCRQKGMEGKVTQGGGADIDGLEAAYDSLAPCIAADCSPSDGTCTTDQASLDAYDLFLADLLAGAGEPVCDGTTPDDSAELGDPDVTVDPDAVVLADPAALYSVPPDGVDPDAAVCTLAWSDVYVRLETAATLLDELAADPFSCP